MYGSVIYFKIILTSRLHNNKIIFIIVYKIFKAKKTNASIATHFNFGDVFLSKYTLLSIDPGGIDCLSSVFFLRYQNTLGLILNNYSNINKATKVIKIK